jgi:hypothetical protein
MFKSILCLLLIIISFGKLGSQSLQRSAISFYGQSGINLKATAGQIANGSSSNNSNSYVIGFQQPLNFKINVGLSIISDTVICGSNKLVIKSGACFTYQWFKNDTAMVGQQTDSITILSAGVYKLVGSDGLNKYDTSKNIRVSFVPKPAKPTLAKTLKDTILCFNDTVRLKGNLVYERYLWSTGDTSSSILVNSPTSIFLRGAVRIGSTSNYCYSDSSNIITVRKNTTPIPSLLRVDDNLYSTDSPNYRWFMNNLASPVSATNVYRILYKGFYAVETSVDKICWSRSKDYIVLNGPASLDQKSYLLSAYPNPTSGFFYLQAKLDKRYSGYMELSIVDQTGTSKWNIKKFVFNENNIRLPINLKLNKGSYSIQVKINGYKTQVIQIIAL